MNCPHCEHPTEVHEAYGDRACAKCGLAGPPEVLEAIARIMRAGIAGSDALRERAERAESERDGRLVAADALEALDRAWEQRCDGYDPWPDNDESNSVHDGPHDATAKHVFDLLRDALAEAYAELAEARHG